MGKKDAVWIWLDLEMTGLDPSADRIIEMATVLTDTALNTLAVGPELVIHQRREVLDGMDEWNQKQHRQSGLVDKVKASSIREAEAEQQTLAFLRQHLQPQTSPLCGNSICQDRRFLAKYMPSLEAFFHYRNLDVSTLKILASHWAPEPLAQFQKSSNHRALEDVFDSIAELKFYRTHFIR